MYLQRITNLNDLQAYRNRWDELAGDCIFRSWDWNTTWWKHYGHDNQLSVFLVFDSQSTSSCQPSVTCTIGTKDETTQRPPELLKAILPCYLDSNFVRGKVLRLLGDGEVCSDYLDLLIDPADSKPATAALARFLCEANHDWDKINFTAIPADSTGLTQLCEELKALNCEVTHDLNQSVWSVALPEDWEAFLAMQSKSHRKQLRQLTRRVLETEQGTWHLVETPDQFEVDWPILIDLHQRRRISLGEPGCFASENWANFHRDIARQLLDTGQLRLSWLEVAGQPVAAEYHYAGKDTTWAYQGGIDPDRISEEPGRLSMIRTFQHAITEGHTQFDLLRGDEPYKAHWRATPQETFDIQIVPARNSARWRFYAYNYLQRAARLGRQLTHMLS